MKSLFIRLYLVLICCFLISTFLSDYWQNRAYREHVTEDYIAYASTLTQAILREVNQGAEFQQIKQWWVDESGGEIEFIELMSSSDPRLKAVVPVEKPQLVTVEITELRDIIEAAIPIEDDQVLLFRFHDAFATYYIATYYIGFLILFLITAPAVYFIARYVYRYLKQLQKAVRDIAAGSYGENAPATSIATFQALSRDINTMSRVLADKVREQQIFNGAIGHELLTPITRLRLALELAKQTDDAIACRELLSEMDEDLDDLTQLTEDVMQLSRACLPDQKQDNSKIDLALLVEKLSLRSGDARVQLNLISNAYLHSNKHLVDTICNNLLNNARKYATGIIEISLQQDKDKVMLTIEDDGVGIPEAERRQIFKPFYRIDNSRSRQSGGSGLGLAIVAELVRKTRGTIHVDKSRLGGARFDIIWSSASSASLA